MKKILGLVFVIVALALGGYYGMGVVTEHTIAKNVEIINQSNGLFVELAEYHRGWYQSTALLNWRIQVPERLSKTPDGQTTTIPAQEYKLQMPVTVYHGPIIYADHVIQFGLGYAESDLAVPPAYAEKFTTMFTPASTIPHLKVSLFVNYANNSQLHVEVPSFELISKQGGDQFTWKGLDSRLGISSNLKTIEGALTIDGVRFTKNKMTALLGKVATAYDLHQTDMGLYLGEASLSLPSFSVAENTTKLIDLSGFEATSSSDVEEGLFHSQFKTSFHKLLVHGKAYGPAVLEMSLTNLDAQALGEINTEANNMQQGPQGARQQAFLTLLPTLPKLFSKGAQFEVSKLSCVVPEGLLEGDLLLSLPKGEMGNPFQLLQKIGGHGSLKLPTTLLKGVMTESAKQKLMTQPTLQQAMISELKTAQAPQQTAAETPPAQGAPAAASSETATAATVVQPTESSTTSQPLTPAEIDQQAMAQTDAKLAALVQSGVLLLQGSEYVVHVTLQNGQLSVNGKPFTAAMMQF